MFTEKEKIKPVVLFVDDDLVTNEYHADLLQGHQYGVVTARSFYEALPVVHSLITPAVAFIDMQLEGEKSGADLIKYMLGVSRQPIVPYLYTGIPGSEVQVKALQMGAIACLEKPVDDSVLVAYVENSGTTILKMINSAMEDGLTGVFNYRSFLSIAERELQLARGTVHGRISIILIDIDHLSEINDDPKKGYVVANRVLSEFGRILRTGRSHRLYDYVFRFGGDEFAVLLPTVLREDARNIAKRLKAEVEKVEVEYGAGKMGFTISFGVGYLERAEMIEDDMVNLERLIKKADKNLKRGRRHRDLVLSPVL